MHLTLHLTRNCNLRCDYCYAAPESSTIMSLETGQKAMRLGVKRNSGSCGVVFFGGEPLLAKDMIFELVEFGRNLQKNKEGMFHFKITTNGLLLDEAFLEYACREEMLIAMSFDGINKVQDMHRKTADGRLTSDLLLPKLRMLLDARPYSSILMVVNPDTAKYLCESVSFLLDEGARYIIVSLNYAGQWDEESFAILEQQYKKLAKLYIKWTEMGRKFYLSPFEVKISLHINESQSNCLRCDLGMRQLSVDPEGYLYPCVQFTRAGGQSQWCIGDVENGINSEAWTRIRKAATKPKENCSKCVLEKRCFHTCACLNWQTTGSIKTVSPLLCRHEQMLMPIADKVAETLYAKRNSEFINKHYNDAYPMLSLLEDQLSSA
jgi:uncharacterized protein